MLQCDADPVESEAREVTEMDIEFTDESLPLEKELNNFDMRNKSSRLNFFEKDVEGELQSDMAVSHGSKHGGVVL